MPKKYAYNPRLDLPETARELINTAARAENKTTAAWIRAVLEDKLGVSFGVRKQAPHGEGKRAKKSGT